MPPVKRKQQTTRGALTIPPTKDFEYLSYVVFFGEDKEGLQIFKSHWSVSDCNFLDGDVVVHAKK